MGCVMPTMIRVYIRSVLIGLLLACCFVAALLALDIAHLRHLVSSSSIGWLAVVMMVMFNTIVFAGVQFAITIMGQAEKQPPPDRGKRVSRIRQFAPVKALAVEGRKR